MKKYLLIICFMFTAIASNYAQATLVCGIYQVATSNYGNYDPTSPYALTYTDMNVYTGCQNNGTTSVSYSFSLTFGTGNSGDQTNRYFLSGSTKLYYNIYRNPSHSTLWGSPASSNGYSESGTVAANSNSNNGNGTILPIYALMAAGQSVPAGTYTDTIVITTNY